MTVGANGNEVSDWVDLMLHPRFVKGCEMVHVDHPSRVRSIGFAEIEAANGADGPMLCDAGITCSSAPFEAIRRYLDQRTFEKHIDCVFVVRQSFVFDALRRFGVVGRSKSREKVVKLGEEGLLVRRKRGFIKKELLAPLCVFIEMGIGFGFSPYPAFVVANGEATCLGRGAMFRADAIRKAVPFACVRGGSLAFEERILFHLRANPLFYKRGGYSPRDEGMPVVHDCLSYLERNHCSERIRNGEVLFVVKDDPKRFVCFWAGDGTFSEPIGEIDEKTSSKVPALIDVFDDG